MINFLKNMAKFLLSTGRSTDKIEYYVLDLFKLYLSVYPGDIPGAPGLGFDFILTDVVKADLRNEIRSRATRLVNKLADRFSSNNVKITIDSIEIFDEKTATLTVTVNNTATDEIEVKLFD